MKKGVIKVRSFRRKVEGNRRDKDYLDRVRGLLWEPLPGSADEYIGARSRLESEEKTEGVKETVVRESVASGVYITKSDLQGVP